ncbi:MAG TPA: succinate dehydrogenase assembly factor 2 [Gammaproteobacteria bacterium]|nr:succinate dehydrogenase assembly factor 2 [Gammaproteobacteria bacterium]
MNERARLRWHCRRGMKELDVLLERYLEQRYDAATPDERAAFETLLTLPDPQLLDYLTGRDAPPDLSSLDVIEQLRAPR